MSSASDRSQMGRWLLAGGVAAAAMWLFQSTMIAPLREGERTTRLKIAELKGRLETARQASAETQAKAEPPAGVRVELEGGSDDRPAASAMVWFPERVKQHFRRFGVAEPVTRQNTTKEEPDLPGFLRTYWAVDLPMQGKQGELGKVLRSVAELEQREPHLRVLDLAIREEEEPPRQRTAVLNVSTLARK